jgi:hypothetical protein
MNSYKTAAISALMVVGLGTQAIAADIEFQFGNDPPIRFHHVRPTIVVRQGTKEIQIQDGLTPLDNVSRKINCRSATGCLVTAKVWVSFDGNDNGPTVSAYVDGVAMEPIPTPNYSNPLAAQQSAHVHQGMHIFQSQVSQGSQYGNITGWSVEYAVYDSK